MKNPYTSPILSTTIVIFFRIVKNFKSTLTLNEITNKQLKIQSFFPNNVYFHSYL